MVDKKFIADKIKEFRKKAGLTQTELAQKIGIGEKQISKIENYTNLPSLTTFFKIIDYLKHSDELNRYNNLVLKYNLTKLGI